MKKRLLYSGAAFMLALSLCGKEKGPTAPVQTAFELDTLAVRAILDSSDLTTIATATVAPTDTSNGEARVVSLNLPGTVTGGKLSTLPAAAIGRLTSLTSLILSGNAITVLPPEIGTLTRLSVLDLSDNRLAELPAEIGNLAALATLKLKNNRLQSIPARVGRLRNLNILILDDNQLTALPDSLAQITPTPSMVSFDNNKICTLSTAIQQWLTAGSLYDPEFKKQQTGCP